MEDYFIRIYKINMNFFFNVAMCKTANIAVAYELGISGKSSKAVGRT
jgi:hypothetical protein